MKDRTVTEPKFIITTSENEKGRVVRFKELYALRGRITSLTILWSTNSYYVNIPLKVFVINGGSPIVVKGTENGIDAELVYAKRNRVEYALSDNSDKNIIRSYILGFVCTVDGMKREPVLHISEDGRFWTWKTSR